MFQIYLLFSFFFSIELSDRYFYFFVGDFVKTSPLTLYQVNTRADYHVVNACFSSTHLAPFLVFIFDYFLFFRCNIVFWGHIHFHFVSLTNISPPYISLPLFSPLFSPFSFPFSFTPSVVDNNCVGINWNSNRNIDAVHSRKRRSKLFFHRRYKSQL